MGTAQDALFAARSYLRDNPEELSRAVRNALGLRVGVPVAALRWIADFATKDGKARDVTIDPVPPGVKVGASVDAAGTPLRINATIYIERVQFTDSELTLALRVEGTKLQMDGEASTPVAALIKSGALDLSNLGTLIGFLPKRPPFLAEANGNRIVLDLMRHPKIGKNKLARHVIGYATSWFTLQSVETDRGHVDVSFRALPRGLRGAFRGVRRHLIQPSIGRLLPR